MLMHVFVLCNGEKVPSQYDDGVRKGLEKVFLGLIAFGK